MTESLPYGLWLLQARWAELDVHERRKRGDYESWDLRHPEEADRLEAMIGREGKLRRDMETWTERCRPKGTLLEVRGRVRDRLLVAASDEILLIKPEWIRLIDPLRRARR